MRTQSYQYIASDCEAVQALQFSKLPKGRKLQGQVVLCSNGDVVFLASGGRLYLGNARRPPYGRWIGDRRSVPILAACVVLGVVSGEDFDAHAARVEHDESQGAKRSAARDVVCGAEAAGVELTKAQKRKINALFKAPIVA